MDYLDKIREIIVKEYDLSPERIVPEADLYKDLELDSLDQLDLIMAFEEAFDRQFPDDELENIKTVGDINQALIHLFS